MSLGTSKRDAQTANHRPRTCGELFEPFLLLRCLALTYNRSAMQGLNID
jgi:hypothetical protein